MTETGPSGGKAFAMSLLLPGLGHKYVNDGHWSNWAITYASTDASLWLGLIGGEWHRNHLVDSYTTLARSAAGAQVAGKDRTFFLNLASFESSDVYRGNDAAQQIMGFDRLCGRPSFSVGVAE